MSRRIRSTIASTGTRCPEIRIQIEARDQIDEPRAAHDVLADRLDPGFELRGHRLPDERFRDLLPLDEHGRRGAIEIRQPHGEAHDHREDGREHEQRRPLAAVPDGEHELDARLATLSDGRFAESRVALRNENDIAGPDAEILVATLLRSALLRQLVVGERDSLRRPAFLPQDDDASARRRTR